MNNSANNKRIARNTAVLYLRTLLTMFISLYTSRVILEILGVEDFGIYNVVGGIVVMFSFLNSAMSSATQRYFSFTLGKGDLDELRDLFSITVNIHFFIAIVITLFAETVGLWFLNTQLNIPSEKMAAANWVFQFSVLTFFLGVISVPYNAMIVSYERMSIYAYVSLFETFAKLGVIFLLPIISFDRLIVYAGLLFSISLVVRIFYGIYCSRQFSTCHYRWIWDKKRNFELIHYAGWNLFGNLAAVGFTQGLDMLLNIFFGPLLNAANGIANQVNGAVLNFVVNFQMALNPQIIKSYAGKDKEYMQKLIFQGSRFSFYLLLLLILPILFQTELILKWWLKEIPEYTVLFIQLMLLNALINVISGPLMTAAQATGEIKLYQAIVGGILLLNLPLSYFFLKARFNPEIIFIVMICVSIIATLARLIILNQLRILDLNEFFNKVIFKTFFVLFVIGCIVFFVFPIFHFSQIVNFVLNTIVVEIIAFSSIWFIGLTREERSYLQKKIRNLKSQYLYDSAL